jgi:CysZ protein
VVTRPLVGFGRGFLAPFGAIGSLWRAPRAWPLALVPVAMLVVVEGGVGLGWWYYLKAGVSGRLAEHGAFVAGLAAWLVLALLLVIGWLLVPVLSAPALEGIVRIIERELGAPMRAPLGFFAEMGCGAQAMLLSLAFTLPLIVGLTLLGLVVPPLLIVTTPLKLLIGVLGVAWSLFDYPLTLRGVPASQRLQLMGRHFSAVLGFGTAFSLLFWLPCLGLVMLPVGVAGATRLYWEIQRSTP